MRADAPITGRTAAEIRGSVTDGIQRGVLRESQALPTVRALADRLGVNRNTVAAAYKQLAIDGLVESDGRRGSRVASARAPIRARSVAGIVDLAGGNPDPALLPDLRGILAKVVLRHRTYDGEPDDPELIEFADAMFQEDKIPVGEIWLANGAFDAIGRALVAGVVPGGRVAVEDPCFMTTLGLLRELKLEPVPMPVDDQGLRPDALAAALSAGAGAVVVTPRAQNPFGGSWTEERTKALQSVIDKHSDVMLIEDDHFYALSEQSARTLVREDRSRWAVIRSVSKHLGPDLRLAFVNSDEATMRSVAGASAFTTRWVSGILQSVVLAAVRSSLATEQVVSAAQAYRERRVLMLEALAERGIKAHGKDGMNVWVPVDDERYVVRRLMEEGWRVRSGSIFRVKSPEALRLTTSAVTKEEAEAFAGALSTILAETRIERGA